MVLSQFTNNSIFQLIAFAIQILLVSLLEIHAVIFGFWNSDKIKKNKFLYHIYIALSSSNKVKDLI